MAERPPEKKYSHEIEISDRDIYEAMKDISGYLDITVSDFKELYKVAYRHALERIARSVKAEEIMTKEVVTVVKETPLMEVAGIMAAKGVAGVPVMDQEKRVVGVISEKDFLKRMGASNTKSFMGIVAECLKGKGCVAVSIRGKNAEDIMSTPPITVKKDAALVDISNTFREKNINRVPVVDSDERLIGIVSREDVVRTPLLKGK